MKTTRLLGIGVAGWIIGMLLLYPIGRKLGKQDTAAGVVLWVLEHWWAAFALGLIALLASAIATKAKPGRALLAYAAPVVLLGALAGICLLVYPNSSFREELAGYLPVAVVFYLFGYLWAAARKEEEGSLARVMVPPLVGGFLILGFVAVPVFTGNAFRYRNAFGLEVVKVQRDANTMTAECVLDIRKPGDYLITAPVAYLLEYIMATSDGGKELPPGTITWGAAGAPKADSTGKFPLTIHWERVPEAPAVMREFESQASPIYLDIHPAENPQETLYTVSGVGTEKPL
jgi:hypothetical protein